MALTYEQKLEIANNYLHEKAMLSWDDLSDINSLHDCEEKSDIIEACNERLEEDGYPTELLESEEDLSFEDDDIEDEDYV